MSKKLEQTITGFLTALVVVTGTAGISTRVEDRTSSTIVAVSAPVKDPFDGIAIDARSAYVYDVMADKALYAKNASVPLPIASITKVMTAITAEAASPQGAEVRIGRDSLREYGDSGLHADERWKLRDLLKYTLVVSSNDGAAAVAAAVGGSLAGARESRAAFVQAMNDTASKLGFSSMRFYNESGLDVDDSTAGGYGSAFDVAMMMRYALSHSRDVIDPTKYPSYTVASLDDVRHEARNTDILADRIPGLIAGKTGYSDLAGGNLAVVFDAGLQRPIVVVVLGSTYDGRFADVEKLANAALQSLAGTTPPLSQ